MKGMSRFLTSKPFVPHVPFVANLFFVSFVGNLFFSTLSLSQSFFPLGAVDSTVPSPRSVLGYQLGERFTDFRLLERYVERVADASPRVNLVQYGETYEHRPLRVAVITSDENHKYLENIKTQNLRLTDPGSLSAAEAQAIVEKLPVIVWLSYGIHGNESSSPEAAMAVLYQLAAGTDERTIAILKNAVVILDPSINPDGRERYVQWYNGRAQNPSNASTDAAEHAEPWPGGRTNHYYFDLNRDWSWLTQQESRTRVALYRQWMPHTHVDFHEMSSNSSYFFFPAAVPVHEALPPEVIKWGKVYGEANAKALDKVGAAYYVGESFDMFYPGYGDSWPTFNGAIGMTYEQAGSGRAGLAIKRTDGGTLTLFQRARNHFVTSIATLETSVQRRKERLQDFANFWKSALEGPDTKRSFVVRADQDPVLANRMVDILLRQGIHVYSLKSATSLKLRQYYSGRTQDIFMPGGTFVVPLSQPERRLATALLEPKTVAKDTFFYDVSAWSLPVAFGLTAYESETPLPKNVERLTEAPIVRGTVVGGKATYAYLIPWSRSSAIRLAWNLLARGHSLSVATKEFTLGGRRYAAGTLVAFVSKSGASLHDDIASAAAETGVDVYATETGLSEKGISLGSDKVQPLRLPSVAVATGEPAFSGSFGELWYLFEQYAGIPFTAVQSSDIGGLNLGRYDVLVLPNGGSWKSGLDSNAVASVKRWVQSGGVVIALDNAARFAGKSGSGLTPALLLNEKKDDEKSKEEKDREKSLKEEQKQMTRFEKEERRRLEEIPGTIFRALVDTTHPIGFGTSGSVYVLKGDGMPFQLTDQGHMVARFSSDTVQVSGFASLEKRKAVANSAYIQEFTVGRGKVILFAENPTFRMFWLGTARLLLNAVLFSPPVRSY